jgi:hypothetical protein
MWLIRSTHSAALRAGSAQDKFLIIFGGNFRFLVIVFSFWDAWFAEIL